MLRLPLGALRYPDDALSLPPDAIHVWFCDFTKAVSGALAKPVSEVLLRRVLARYSGFAGERILQRGAHGKPFFGEGETPDFNLSHSREHALIALAHGQPVGIDIEHTGRTRSMLGLAQRYFCASESAALGRLSGERQQLAFLQLWTCKEAVLKALGRGIAFGLDRLEFTLDDDGAPIRLHSIGGEAGHARDWHLMLIQPARDYLGALAWHGSARKVNGWLEPDVSPVFSSAT